LRRSLLIAFAALAVTQPLVWAGEDDSGDGSRPEWAEDGNNEVAVFVGVTDVAGDAGGSLGLDYEYRFTRIFGLGATAEYTAADLREWLFAVSFNFHVWKELKIFGAPGVEIETEDGTDSFVFRVGVEYGFDIGRGWEAAPALNFDITSEDTAIVIGVGFGRHF
jgi:hypothetical protein